MASLLEVLVSCDSNNTLWTCCIWDPHTGTNLMTYKGGGTAEPRTLSFIGKDYLATVERTKPVLHVWPLNSHQTVQGMRFILPGKTGALTVSNDGNYCIAGINEKIYIWQIASGNLITIINRHYQKVVLLKFTPDGRFFVSAAEDGMVMVWSLATVTAHPEVELVSQRTAGQFDPIYIFSDHSLPITDLCISKTGINGRLVTSSSDRTCKIYDLTSGEMLLNLVFDVPLTAVTLDVLELKVFVGTSEGKIYQLSLTNPPRTRDFLVNSDDSQNHVFSIHTKAVTCLSASLGGEILMSGGDDDQIILWHIQSCQPVRTIKHKGPITNAFFTVNIQTIYKQVFCPSIILHSLERTLEKDADHVIEIEVLVNKSIDFWPMQETYNNHSYNNAPELELKTNDENSVKDMAFKEELDKLKQINASLYAFSIQKALDSAPLTKDLRKNMKKFKKRT